MRNCNKKLRFSANGMELTKFGSLNSNMIMIFIETLAYDK